MNTLKRISQIALVGLLFFIASCNKDDATGKMSVRMTDQPGDFDTVNVEVLEVQVHYSDDDGDDDGEWVTLPTEAGNYDLLLLQDGVTVVLTEDAEVPVGYMGQMRLILGDNNYVVVDDEMHPLALSSQDKTGLKFNLNTELGEDEEIEIVFDFDASESIILTGSGTYRLKPVVKVLDVLYI